MDWPPVRHGMYGMPPTFSDELIELIAHWRMKGASLDEITQELEDAYDGARDAPAQERRTG